MKGAIARNKKHYCHGKEYHVPAAAANELRTTKYFFTQTAASRFPYTRFLLLTFLN